MSTKKWKNQELKSLLSEAWGFNMDLSKLNEAKGQEEPLEEMCPGAEEGDDMETMMVVGSGEENHEGGEESAEDLAHELLGLAQRLGDALGVDSNVSTVDVDEEEPMEEVTGRKDPARQQSRGDDRVRDDRKRPMEEAQLRAIIKKALIEATTKGK